MPGATPFQEDNSSPQEANSGEANKLKCRWGGEAPFPEPSKEWMNFFFNVQTQQRASPQETRKSSSPTAQKRQGRAAPHTAPALPQVRRRTGKGTNRPSLARKLVPQMHFSKPSTRRVRPYFEALSSQRTWLNTGSDQARQTDSNPSPM